MLDLDLINNKNISIKVNGELIKVNQPTFCLAKKIRAYEQNIKNMSEEEIYQYQSEILLNFLNNNSSSKKFSDKDIDCFTFSGIKALYQEIIKSIIGTEENPN